jgi:ankyrin repeat protein
MQLLVQAGCDTAAVDKNGANALMCTIVSGEVSAVRVALDAGWCELEARDMVGFTAFLRACTKGHVQAMELLVEADCDTAVTCNGGYTALMCTAHSGEAAAVRAALDAGWCELEAGSSSAWIIGGTAFLAAWNKGSMECMELLVQAGCDTSVTDSGGKNALLHTALSGEAAAVRAALDAGWCDLEARATGGLTAFLRACYTGDTECMELLVRAGCDTAAPAQEAGSDRLHPAVR